MSELDLLNLARSTTEHEVTWFAQMITINFGMIVAIYYFLNSARVALKIFSFVAYTVGMTVLLGQMLVEANVKVGAVNALRLFPPDQLSKPTLQYLAVFDSWVAVMTRATFNLSIWVLWLGILYLLFVWKEKPNRSSPGRLG